jgi:uncharacterized DUF497 family protein
MDGDRFEWDDRKAAVTLERRGLSFEVESTVFRDPMRVESPDLRKDYGEQRIRVLGRAADGVVLAVIYTERGDRIRIISVRRATRQERRFYEQASRT